MKTVHLSIKGRVQGVWYRAWTRETALNLGLKGWVRNRMDGSVEAVLAGDADTIAEMIKLCWDGPKAAHVEDIQISESEEQVNEGFTQKKTA